VIGRVCWFVSSFVSFVSRKAQVRFREIWYGRSASAPNVTVNVREVKVKVNVQGHLAAWRRLRSLITF